MNQMQLGGSKIRWEEGKRDEEWRRKEGVCGVFETVSSTFQNRKEGKRKKGGMKDGVYYPTRRSADHEDKEWNGTE